MDRKSPLYIVFIAVLFVFFYFSMNYWNTNMANNLVGGEGRMNLIGTFMLEMFCLASIVLYGKNIIWQFEEKLCVVWIVLMSIAMTYSRGSLPDRIFTIFWPVLYLGTQVLFSDTTVCWRRMKTLFVVLILFGLPYLISNRQAMTSAHGTNSIYYIFLEMPLLLCVRNKKLQFVLLCLFSLLAFVAMKRSILIATAIMWFFYIYIELWKHKKSAATLLGVVIALCVISFMFSYVDDAFGGAITERINREETNTGRNRLAIYEVTLAMQAKSSVGEWLFGHGHFAVYKDSFLEISAHNDFLEVLYDYGILILLLYLSFMKRLITRCRALYKSGSEYFFPFVCSLAILFTMSMVSHLILYNSYFMLLVVFWAMIAKVQKNGSDNKCNI